MTDLPATISSDADDDPVITPVQQKLILHFGEMGARWGVNRTVAQVHALLYVIERPLPADAIARVLQVARSNVSTSIRELLAWGIVHQVSLLGERRDHFTTTADVWEMFQTIVDERKRRELDPTLELLGELVKEADASGEENDHTRRRLRELHQMLGTLARWYTQIRHLPQGAIVRFVKMGSKVFTRLGIAS